MTPGFYWARYQHGQAWLVAEVRLLHGLPVVYIAGIEQEQVIGCFSFQPFRLVPPNLNGTLACENETCTNTFTPHRYGQKYCNPECQYLQSRRLSNRKKKERNDARKKAFKEKAARASRAYSTGAFRDRHDKG